MAVGFTYELCAGIIDKPGLSLTKIMQEEVIFVGGRLLGRRMRLLGTLVRGAAVHAMPIHVMTHFSAQPFERSGPIPQPPRSPSHLPRSRKSAATTWRKRTFSA